MTPREQELETALRELYGSYQSLAAQIKWLGISALRWDGPICTRRALGLSDPEDPR